MDPQVRIGSCFHNNCEVYPSNFAFRSTVDELVASNLRLAEQSLLAWASPLVACFILDPEVGARSKFEGIQIIQLISSLEQERDGVHDQGTPWGLTESKQYL